MKIAHIIGYYQPQLRYQEHQTSQIQHQMGHEVHLITSTYTWPDADIVGMLKQVPGADTRWKIPPGTTNIQGVVVHRLPTKFKYVDLFYVTGLKELLRTIKPDVVICHETKTGITTQAALWKEELGYHLICNQHDFYHAIPHHPLWKRIARYVDYFWIRRWFVIACLKKAEVIISPVPDVRKFLETKHGIDPSRITDIPLAINVEMFIRTEEARARVREKNNFADNETVFIFAGRIDRRKRVEKIINAIQKLREQGFPVRLLIVGDGDAAYVAELHALAQSLTKGLVQFTGFVGKSGLKEFFSAADVAIFPGNNSIAIMEAMANQLPIVISDLQLGYLAHDGAGYAFPDGSDEAMTEKMRLMVEQPEERRRMGKQAFDIVNAKYSDVARAKRITQLCQELVEKTSVSAG